MTEQEVMDEIKLELTGYKIKMITDESAVRAVIHKALRELNRYWDETTLVTVPWSNCIDLSSAKDQDGNKIEKVNAIVKIYRTEGVGDITSEDTLNDPFYAQQWMLFSNGGTMYNINDYIMNYASWITLSKIRNTISTDMSIKFDIHNGKLYPSANTIPSYITIEYIPKLTKVEDIKSDFWIDILVQLCVALTKVVEGRIKTAYKLNGALWDTNGEKLLEEGNTELKDLREKLRVNSNLIFPID